MYEGHKNVRDSCNTGSTAQGLCEKKFVRPIKRTYYSPGIIKALSQLLFRHFPIHWSMRSYVQSYVQSLQVGR